MDYSFLLGIHDRKKGNATLIRNNTLSLYEPLTTTLSSTANSPTATPRSSFHSAPSSPNFSSSPRLGSSTMPRAFSAGSDEAPLGRSLSVQGSTSATATFTKIRFSEHANAEPEFFRYLSFSFKFLLYI
jgi:hypothetical protein